MEGDYASESDLDRELQKAFEEYRAAASERERDEARKRFLELLRKLMDRISEEG
jgi:hypothetical protein